MYPTYGKAMGLFYWIDGVGLGVFVSGTPKPDASKRNLHSTTTTTRRSTRTKIRKYKT